MRLWLLWLAGCGGTVAVAATAPDASIESPDVNAPSLDAATQDAAPESSAPGACTFVDQGESDWCEIKPDACGDGGMVVTCTSSGMVAWPTDENGQRIDACEQTDFSDGGLRPVYCCPKTCIRARRADCSACDGGRAMACPDSRVECR